MTVANPNFFIFVLSVVWFEPWLFSPGSEFVSIGGEAFPADLIAQTWCSAG
jgi:hypothetical protein